jgi:hypothetical protein
MSQAGEKTGTPSKGNKKTPKKQAPPTRPQEVEDSEPPEDEEEEHSEAPQPQAEESPRKGRKTRPYKPREQSHSMQNEKVRSSLDYSVEEPDSSQDKALTRHQRAPPAAQQQQGGQPQGNQQGGGEKKGSGMPSVRLDVNLVSRRNHEHVPRHLLTWKTSHSRILRSN